MTLGVPRLDVADTDVVAPHAVGPSKALALITFLAFAPRRSASRDTLCDLLWGDRAMDLSRPQLRQTLWLIKTQIHSRLLCADAENVALSSALTSDADEFAAAIEGNDLKPAIALYSGDFFIGYAAPGAGRFEEWASLERTRFRALFVRAAESLARQALNSGRFADAIALAHRLRIADPNGQTSWRVLLESRIASGDSIGARADADQFEEWLRIEEWEAEPASLAALQSARRSAKPDASATDSNKLVAELVGREREFAAIHDAWVAAKARGARVIHIVADSGIGKTRLTRDIVARIRAGRGMARYSRANYGERHIPFSFAAAVAEVLAAAPGAGGVAPAAARTLVSLNPSLFATYLESPSAPEHLEALRVGLALLELASAIAEEDPIALALDDMHWCDSASREALTVFASHLKSQNVLLITTARPHYAPGALHTDSSELHLSRLSQTEVGELVTSLARLPETSWAGDLPARLCEAAGGNPLFVLEALRFCLDTGLLSRNGDTWECRNAEALFGALEQKATLDGRLAALSASERAILHFLGIAGMPTGRDIITEAAGLRSAEADEAADNLELHGLLVTEDNMWGLAHDAIGETMLSGGELGIMKASHARLGAAMAASDDLRWKKKALVHFAEGEQWARAAESAIPFLRRTASSSAEVDAQLASLLGSATTERSLVRVRQELPFRLRRPALLRQGLVVGVLLLAASGMFAFSTIRNKPRDSDSMLVVLNRAPNGNTEVRSANLDLDRWDPTSPLPVTARPTTEWAPFNPDIPVASRPGSESWALNTTYPDSGQGDIDLLDRDGRRVRLTHSPGEDRPMSFSPDGRQLLFLTTRWSSRGWSDVAALDLKTLAVRRLTMGNATNTAAFWSPDGTRIAFTRDRPTREGEEICTVDADGSNARCPRIPNWRLTSPAGWVDEHRLLIMADSSDVRDLWKVYDIDRGTMVSATFPAREMVSLDPTGAWALTSSTANGQRSVRVSPSDRFDLARIVAQDPAPPTAVWFASPHPPTSFLDSLAILRPGEPLALGIPHQLMPLGWSKGRRRMSPVTVRWRSLTPSIAPIDSLGVLLPRDTGNAVIELSAGGWRIKRDTIRIGPVSVATLLDERWGPNAFNRWRVFGDPQPVILKDGKLDTFYNNGDGMFFSGAYLRNGFDTRRGIAMDFDVSTPITRTQWQVVIAGTVVFRDAEHLTQWDHKTGYLQGVVDRSPGCWFKFPQGEGARATTDLSWFPSLRVAIRDSSYRIDTGKWYRVRLQIFPDGRCGTAINGHALTIEPGNGPLSLSVHAIIQGSSVATRILVGRVLVQSGVPTDIDWTPLRFTGYFWERDERNVGRGMARRD